MGLDDERPGNSIGRSLGDLKGRPKRLPCKASDSWIPQHPNVANDMSKATLAMVDGECV